MSTWTNYINGEIDFGVQCESAIIYIPACNLDFSYVRDYFG